MFSIKKKGQILENKFAKQIMRFVFVFLSFFFAMQVKSFAQVQRYKYIFDVGGGNKFVYTVDEETNYQVTNPNRYTIVNKELQGYANSLVGYEGVDAATNPIYMKDILGIDLTVDAQKTLYNWCCYLHKSTDSGSSRKFMKSLLICFIDAGYDLRLGDSGNKADDVFYLKPGLSSDSANDAVQDNDYSYFWYNDTYWKNTNFKKQFDSISGDKTPFVRSYLKNDHIYLKNTSGQTVSLYDKISADKTMFSYINQAIENKTAVGNYFAPMKVEINEITQGDTLVWWYREGSYNESEHSILVDCAKQKGDTPLFTFKYSATGELLEEPSYTVKTNENNSLKDYSSFEYFMKLDPEGQGGSIYVYPDFTGGSKKTCKSKFKQASKEIQQTGKFYLALNGVSYAQTGDQYIYVTEFNPDNFKPYNKSSGTAYGDKVCTVPAEELKNIIKELGGKLDDGLLIKENNGYVFAYDKKTGDIHFYRKDDPAEVEYVGMNMNLKQMYAPFAKSTTNNIYGISLKADPQGRNGRKFKPVWSKLGYDLQDRLNILTTAGDRAVLNEQGEKYDVSWSLSERKKAMYYNLYKDANIDCMLSVRDLTPIAGGYRGDNNNTTIPVSSCPIIAEVSIRDWLEIEYEPETKQASKHAKQVSETDSLTAALDSIEETRTEMVPFIKMLFRFSRPVILFLILIAICLTAIYSIVNHNDPEKRVLVKVRLKNIFIGILVFSVSALIVALCIEYFTQATDLMFAEETDIDLNITSPYSMDKNWLLKLLLNLIGAVANGVKWVVDFLATRMLRLDEREVDLATCIFGVENGGGLSLYPFEEQEWTLYMYGYRMLTFVAMAFISIAVVKNIIMTLVGAGNIEKMTAVKSDFLRIFVAILCIVIIPYAIRLLLTITNNMVLLLPVSANMFDLKFDQYNELEPICNLVYYIIEIKVYLAFTVRKVMIAFLIISAPAIFGIWAISDRFRSFNLWFGELLTNTFMQFTYAFAFFFLVMIISTTKNPIVILMMLSMLIKLADFVKESLQGLFTKWGGINETGVANEAFNKLKDAPIKVWGEGKKITKKTGKTMMNASKVWDKTGTRLGAKRLNNVGAVLSGRWGDIRTERDRLEAIKKYNDGGRGRQLRKSEAALTKEIEMTLNLTGDVNAKALYKKALNGNLSPEEIENMKSAGGVLGQIASLTTVKDDIKEHERRIHNLDDDINKLGGLSALRGSVSKEVLNNLKEQAKNEKNNVADIYEHTLDDFDRLEDKMNESIDKLSSDDISPEDKTKEETELKHILEQVIDKAQIISEVSIELNMTGGTERMDKIRKAQASAVREKASRFDKELKTEAMDSIQITQDNLETLDNRTKQGENAPKDVSKKDINTSNN